MLWHSSPQRARIATSSSGGWPDRLSLPVHFGEGDRDNEWNWWLGRETSPNVELHAHGGLGLMTMVRVLAPGLGPKKWNWKGKRSDGERALQRSRSRYQKSLHHLVSPCRRAALAIAHYRLHLGGWCVT